jgi:hypothetical protein
MNIAFRESSSIVLNRPQSSSIVLNRPRSSLNVALVLASVSWGGGPELPEACLLGHNIYELLAPQLLKKRSSVTVNAQLVDHSIFPALGCIARLDPRDAIDRFKCGSNGREENGGR